jgi:hypothetical protein
MSIALFVSEEYLLENSVINENVAYTQIRPTLVKVQDMHIQPALGSALYKEVQAQVVSGSVTPHCLKITSNLQSCNGCTLNFRWCCRSSI